MKKASFNKQKLYPRSEKNVNSNDLKCDKEVRKGGSEKTEKNNKFVSLNKLRVRKPAGKFDWSVKPVGSQDAEGSSGEDTTTEEITDQWMAWMSFGQFQYWETSLKGAIEHSCLKVKWKQKRLRY